MNCREALEHLYDYLDRELNEQTIKKIKAHLSICDHCLDRYEFERQLQELIIKRGNVDVNAEPLKQKVMQRIAELDAQNPPSFFSRFRPFLAAIAAVIVVAVGIYSQFDRKSSELLAKDVGPYINGHIDCIRGLTSGTQQAMSRDELLTAVSVVGPEYEEFLKQADDRELTWATTGDFGDSTVHCVYKHGGKEISIIVLKGRDIQPPSGLKVMTRGKHDYLYSSLDGQNVLLWKCKGTWYVAVSELGVECIAKFASGF